MTHIQPLAVEYPLVMVTWVDHTSSSDWKHKGDYATSDIVHVSTIGWLVHKDRHKYVIHNCMIHGESMSGGESVIARKNIIEEHTIEMT
jgi:hypothetical protein